jgi:hypothetical protein
MSSHMQLACSRMQRYYSLDSCTGERKRHQSRRPREIELFGVMLCMLRILPSSPQLFNTSAFLIIDIIDFIVLCRSAVRLICNPRRLHTFHGNEKSRNPTKRLSYKLAAHAHVLCTINLKKHATGLRSRCALSDSSFPRDPGQSSEAIPDTQVTTTAPG